MGFFFNFFSNLFFSKNKKRTSNSFSNIFNYRDKKDNKQFTVSTETSPINFNSLEKTIKYTIKKKDIFIEAFTHRSYIQINEQKKNQSYERLEYLGDSVLNLIVGEFLFNKYPEAEEGTLTKIRSRLVNKKALFEYAQNFNLNKYILLNTNAIITYPKGIESILADTFESLIAAIYLDGGFLQSQKFITDNILSNKKIMQRALFDDNYKSALLEYSQANGFGSPRYEIVSETGPNHNPTFMVSVFLEDKHYGDGVGKNKKEAEQESAKNALTKLILL